MKKFLVRYLLPAGVTFVLTFLLSKARFSMGLSPFYTGGYLPLLSLGGNFFAFSAAYFLARFAAIKTKFVLIESAFLVLGASIPMIVGLIRRRRFHPFYTIISAFFGELPSLLFRSGGGVFLFLANSALTCLFCFLILSVLSRFQKGGFFFETWEALVLPVAFFAFGAGSYATCYFGITPYYLFLSLVLPLSALLLGADAVPLAFAIGGAAVSGEVAPVLAAAVACILSEAVKSRRVLVAFSLLVSEAAVFFLFKRFSPLNFLFLFSGGFLVAFLPDAFYKKCVVFLGKGEKEAPYAVVNKTRLEIAGKLGHIGEALRKTSESLSEISSEGGEAQAATRLSADFSAALCDGCEGLRDCAKQGGGSTAPLFLPAVERALKGGKATICDLPSYLNGNCVKVKTLLEGLNEAAKLYGEERAELAARNAEKEKLAVEAEGIAGVLDVLKKELRRTVSFDGKREKRILSELRREGFSVYDVMVADGDGMTSVTLTMEEEKAKEADVTEILSRILDEPLLLESIGTLGAGSAAATFRSAPPFDAVVGQSVRLKEGSDACGDTKSVTRLNGDRIMIALSDGMGSGEAANRGSTAAISLVENFYRTGVDEKTVLPLINHLLRMQNDGSFQTLDMCVVDLRTAEADFIKLSAPESVIKRKEGADVVEGGALPLGILREIKPSISRKKLSSGDVVILATDGVTDAIGTDGIMRVAESGRTNNPQTIADNIVRDASYVSRSDDQTVVALRLFRRVG